MAEAAVSFLLEELKEVLKWYKDLLSGSENEFQQLYDDLNDIKAFLRDAASKSEKDEVYKEMERQIREVVYVVEDTIDTCLTKAAAAKEKNSVRRRLTSNSTPVRLADEVKSLREDKVKPVIDKVRDGLAALGAATTADQPPSRPKKDQTRSKVVGFEDEEATLISYCTEETKELDVISIIGMPGLGKTTLAWRIFENEQIRYQFPIRIWVYVSQGFNSRDVFLNILRIFISNDMSGLSDEELAQSVRACLAEEKFLLVMDDVWNSEDWKVIKNVLPINNGLSKVMITSRDWKVGTHANVRRQPHMLRFFKDEESWKLLQLQVFGDVEECPSQLLMIGQQIAKQCNGVPLTVVVIGGILMDLFMKTRVTSILINEWENVSQNVNEFIWNDPDKRISDVVQLSYNRLPDHLRECFLYMAVFPEDHVIPAWMLTRLWIAEGFVQPRGDSLEEAANENLSDLVSRNLLVLDKINPMGEIKTCRVHDIIRAFCREIALEQNLFQEIKRNRQGVLEPPISEVPKFHRLCLHSDLTNLFFSTKPNGPCIRSFLCFEKEPVNLNPRYVSTIPDAFLKLRVLESTSIKFHQFPAKVTKLIHLRYVTLHIGALSIRPEPLSQLWNLQTLVIKTKSSAITMKANIWRMYRLRHLKMKAAIVLNEKWDGEGGENLQTLSRLAPESCTAVSKRACNLKALGIRGNLATLFSTMSMENLGRLERLKLMNDLYEHRPVGLPQHIYFPPNLMRLTLSNTFLDWQHMSTLAKIKTLEVLKLIKNAFSGTCWNAAADVFESLQILLIMNADLVVWVASADNFPSLRCLVLKNCENLWNIPGGLASNLDTLDIERLGKSAVESASHIEREKMSVDKHQTPKSGVRFKLHVGPGCGTNIASGDNPIDTR